MTQYDAGPGDWSDREWEADDWESRPHAKRRRVALPPWALLAIFVALLILLCVGLVGIFQALGGGDDQETPTPEPTATRAFQPTPTVTLAIPTVATPPTTPTVALPTEPVVPTPSITEIGPGATVIVRGTGGKGLNLRDRPTMQGRRVDIVRDGSALLVLDGPEEANGYVWWQVQTQEGRVGWGAADWLVLRTDQ